MSPEEKHAISHRGRAFRALADRLGDTARLRPLVATGQLALTLYLPDAPGDVWGTILEGDYPTDGGEALLTPSFTVDAETYLMEIYHYYDAEYLWDGGNVKIDGNIIAPLVGYPGVINVPGVVSNTVWIWFKSAARGD